MRQKSIGALPGIYGRLGNLGGINQKYDVAISTAAGKFHFILGHQKTVLPQRFYNKCLLNGLFT